ncbi:ubiquinol--cytochrome-c reductase catalytic subunit rip1 [Tieghemiomyces parasiticus]|uniref:Cytochrome b-c1 complex subunit Rieske, mitochondrial n=1 Tax=Tieghemiomyces parasiticus TaxID=78921 RepID=A0A9W8ADL3_9FUNG|nr:ubiquinol--cytochrome-c reductase catalytic subunit rip1 [Tieghemiomyces parasiticus]
MSFPQTVKTASSLLNKTYVTAPSDPKVWRTLLQQANLKLKASQPATIPTAAVRRNVQLGAQGHQLFRTNVTAPNTGYQYQTRLASNYAAGDGTTEVPDFSAYRKDSTATDEYASRNMAYFMVGTTGFISAAVAKNTVHEFLTNLSASADVLAMAKAEVDLTSIPEGKNVIVKWRGKPVFIRHRTAADIQEANSVNIASLRDPQTDADRVQKPEWLVMLGICTHLGCVPVGESGDFGGWYCPCHGSHYDISGRIRKGPAPLNLEIPKYEIDGDKLVIG